LKFHLEFVVDRYFHPDLTQFIWNRWVEV